MLEDFARHPGFTLMVFGALALFIIWAIYVIKREDEKMEISYAQTDLLWRILERV